MAAKGAELSVPHWSQGDYRETLPGEKPMSVGTLLLIILVIALMGGFSGRFGGYGYGYGHGGVGILGTILIIVVVLVLLGRI